MTFIDRSVPPHPYPHIEGIQAFLSDAEFIANEGVLTYNFKHHSEIAGGEYNVAVMHYCAVPEVDDETKMDILKRASKWYKKYCVWEDNNIRMEEIAKYN